MTAKSPRGEEERSRALELYQAVGLAGAHEQTGIPKSSIRRWAKAAGIEPADVTKAAAEQTRAAAEAARAELDKRIAEAREQIVPKLAWSTNEALDAMRAILTATRAVQTAAATGSVPEHMLKRLELVSSGPSIKELVGVWTRGIHDMELLTGQATERQAQEVRAVFLAPRPDRSAPIRVVDLSEHAGHTVIDQ